MNKNIAKVTQNEPTSFKKTALGMLSKCNMVTLIVLLVTVAGIALYAISLLKEYVTLKMLLVIPISIVLTILAKSYFSFKLDQMEYEGEPEAEEEILDFKPRKDFTDSKQNEVKEFQVRNQRQYRQRTHTPTFVIPQNHAITCVIALVAFFFWYTNGSQNPNSLQNASNPVAIQQTVTPIVTPSPTPSLSPSVEVIKDEDKEKQSESKPSLTDEIFKTVWNHFMTKK